MNNRPLTVLSMVYWLWAGVRLVDAIAWQESWAHPGAFGFRPARSALDGAAVTQVLSVIPVNVLTTIWKWEVDSLRRQVCARTTALPPVLDEDAADDLELEAPLPLKDAGPGYVALGSTGYADDTQAVALGAASLQETVPATEEWLQVTVQDVRVDKSCSWA